MYLTIYFGYKPVNTGNLIKQYLRSNAKTSTKATPYRESILKFMGSNLDKVEPLTHDIGDGRQMITGVTQINSTKGRFPTAHVSYVSSSPKRSKLAKQGAMDDLVDNLYAKLGDEGMFDLTPVNSETRDMYSRKLGTDLTGQGSGRGLAKAIRQRVGRIN
jgi:hypothetical protein